MSLYISIVTSHITTEVAAEKLKLYGTKVRYVIAHKVGIGIISLSYDQILRHSNFNVQYLDCRVVSC